MMPLSGGWAGGRYHAPACRRFLALLATAALCGKRSAGFAAAKTVRWVQQYGGIRDAVQRASLGIGETSDYIDFKPMESDSPILR